MRRLSNNINSAFKRFENFLRTQIDLVEDDVKLVLYEQNSSFLTYEITPAIYTFEDISEALFNILEFEYAGPSNVIVIENDDITMKTKLVVRFGIIAIKFDEKSFFSTVLCFPSGWDYKHYDLYTSQKNLNLGSTNKIQLKCDIIDGSVVNGLTQPILFSFVLDKYHDTKCFANLKQFIIKKRIKVF